MKRHTTPLAFAAIAVVLGLTLRTASSVTSGGWQREWVAPVVMLFCWAVVELKYKGARERAILDFQRWVIVGIAMWLALRSGLRIAFDLGILGSDWIPLAKRLNGVVTGLNLALWGNFLPKLVSPWDAEEQPFDWAGVHRFVGWGAMLAGVLIVIAWALAPLDLAKSLTLSLFAGFAIATLVRKFYSLATYQPPHSHRLSP